MRQYNPWVMAGLSVLCLIGGLALGMPRSYVAILAALTLILVLNAVIRSSKSTLKSAWSYSDPGGRFTLVVPVGWKEKRANRIEFTSSGGAVAFKSSDSLAEINISVGGIKEAWIKPDNRARALQDFYSKAPPEHRPEAFDVFQLGEFAGEDNAVQGVEEFPAGQAGWLVRSRGNLISVVRNGVEHVIQFRTSMDHLDETVKAVYSFRFLK